jgi:hypothetical protein
MPNERRYFGTTDPDKHGATVGAPHETAEEYAARVRELRDQRPITNPILCHGQLPEGGECRVPIYQINDKTASHRAGCAKAAHRDAPLTYADREAVQATAVRNGSDASGRYLVRYHDGTEAVIPSDYTLPVGQNCAIFNGTGINHVFVVRAV